MEGLRKLAANFSHYIRYCYELIGNASKAALNDVTRPKSRKGAKIAHLNIVSLRKNKLELEVLVNDHKFDVLGLCETSLNENVQDRVTHTE